MPFLEVLLLFLGQIEWNMGRMKAAEGVTPLLVAQVALQ